MHVQMPYRISPERMPDEKAGPTGKDLCRLRSPFYLEEEVGKGLGRG
jgi:hypothetical protein